MGYISWNRGAALTNREDRRSEFRKVIKTFDQAVYLAKEDSDRGRLHFWLGRFHGELMEYDSSAKHFEMAKALRAFPVECRLYLGWEHIEQEFYDQAERHLRDALQEIFKSSEHKKEQGKLQRAPLKESPSDWWRTAGEFSEGRLPPGYFLLKIYLFLALVFAERGCDVARAKPLLGFVDQHMHFLGEPPPLAERDDRRRYEERRLEIAALYKDYLGWVCHLDGTPRQAREHIETSVKMHEDPESLYHLARVYLESGEKDRALKYCDRARTVDIRGAFEARTAKIEVEASRSR
jgi:tetratricopeptide (TPR) repeat protein